MYVIFLKWCLKEERIRTLLATSFKTTFYTANLFQHKRVTLKKKMFEDLFIAKEFENLSYALLNVLFFQYKFMQ